MTKTSKPFDPFARPTITEDEKVQLGDLGVYVLTEMSHSRVALIDEMQAKTEGENVGLGEVAYLLCDLLGTALVPEDGSEVDLATKLKAEYEADRVTVDGLSRAVQHVTGLIGGETTKGN